MASPPGGASTTSTISNSVREPTKTNNEIIIEFNQHFPILTLGQRCIKAADMTDISVPFQKIFKSIFHQGIYISKIIPGGAAAATGEPTSPSSSICTDI